MCVRGEGVCNGGGCKGWGVSGEGVCRGGA